MQSWNAYETSKKSNKIWLKELNSRISGYERLNGPKFSNGLISKFTKS